MYLRLGLSCLILIIYITSTTLAKSNGPPGAIPRGQFVQRYHSRRAIEPSEFLTPPASPGHRNQFPGPPPSPHSGPLAPPKNPYRHGKLLNSLPQHSSMTEAPGFFSRFMSWINPFSGRSYSSSPPAQSLPARPPPQVSQHIQNGDLIPPPVPHQPQYQPPADHTLPKPPSPPTGQSYLPPLSGKNCDSCNEIPWIPLSQAIEIHHRPPAPSNNVPASNNIGLRAPSYEVKTPDFGYGPPQLPHEILPQASNPQKNIESPIPQMHYPSMYTGPLPNPHLYPGAMPPLFKATIFNPQPELTGLIPPNHEAGINLQSTPELHHPQGNLNQPSELFPGSAIDNIHSGAGYVDVLPSGAEVVTGSGNYQPCQSQEIHHDSGASSSNYLNLHPDSAVPSESLQPTVKTGCPTLLDGRSNDKNIYETKVLPSGHIIHIEESPVIDLANNDKQLNDSSVSSSHSSSIIHESSVILQNPDGTFGINTTIPPGDNDDDDDKSYIYWTTSSEAEIELTSISPPFGARNNIIRVPNVVVNEEKLNSNENLNDKIAPQNVSSLLLNAFKNTDNLTEYKSDSYGSNSDNINVNLTEKNYSEINSGLMKDDEVESSHLQFDSREIHPGAGFTPSFGVRQEDNNKNNEQLEPVNNLNISGDDADQRGVKKNKQVQIIIPYTSQYTPSPFHPSEIKVTEVLDKTHARKVSELNDADDTHVDDTSVSGDINKLSYILKALNGWPKVKDDTTKSADVKVNTSIDVLRLQKNIDNWTIQEYSRGTTVSTVSPKLSHPHLSQSKKIPDEYLTTTEPISNAETIREVEKNYGNVLAGFNYNDLDHEGSASSRVDTPGIRVSSFEREDLSIRSTTESDSTTVPNSLSEEDDSWEQLPVTISPSSNERVYVVTAQSALKSQSFSSTEKNNHKNIDDSTAKKFESIEQAYQVLPEAVNNLAVASTGPATVPLWGIMEHEKYVKASDKTNETEKSPILYSGHSKVSHTRQ